MQTETFSDAALVVLGHGTELNAGSAVPAAQHAAALRRGGLFAEVREAFWKQAPQIKSVLAELAAPRIFIVPLFISEGWFSMQIIPQELGFSFPDHLKIRTPHAQLFYCRPVGTHDQMTEVILSRAAGVMSQFPFPRAPRPAETTLLIAGHGTEKHDNSRAAVERQVELIRALNRFAAVHAVYLEEAPRIGDWPALAPTKNVVVVPFFMSDGLHVVEDIPVLLGEPERVVKERHAAGQPAWRNPTELRGRRIWYSAAVGTEPLLAGVILERVREAAN